MSRLDPSDISETSTAAQLRRERAELLSLDKRKHWRLHRQHALTGELKRITTELLKHELDTARAPSPLGDAGAAGGKSSPRLPYKD